MSFQITIEPLGQAVAVRDGQTVLDACLRAGVWLPHACGHGVCGTCKVQVLEGECEHNESSSFALMDFERDEGKILACCATASTDIVVEADIDEDPDAQFLPLEDYRAELVEARMLTPTIRGLWLKPDRPVSFQAGQYVMLQVPGVEGERAFSIANSPDEALIELHIRRVPEGRATGWLHDTLQVGQTLHFTAPSGRFFVRKSAGLPLIFVAGGSGLSSPKSMILDLLAEGSTLPITLVQGARNEGELYFRELFEQLAQKHPNFNYVPALSDLPADTGWSGARGYAHEALKARFEGDFRGHQAYLCGPPPMIEGCIATLMQGRLFERDIYTEKFFTAADAANAAPRSPLFRKL
ncbi:NADH:ubiquinone reductase (Na(+)-transporting) subunit F [Methylibium petroleiphilum]|uniref:Phenol hydrolase reductase n=1 Tax=Methylibium petroleiphilum (strain ATCC BAA-1232 / LMG 22953 / PM1) TaxID=420662 RepID=A2SI47_METPP|nr:2Fe-2S iron-sulfur cluster binding domain-containing protein [Methylibium petroleiphilum]ABM95236.1 phenol hydrolase reductase [Methylibium petroleiphilum PM1]